jgi:GTP cyclohydrolase I
LIDQTKIEKAVLSIIEAIGEDPNREGMVGTPRRIAEMYSELFMGLGRDPKEELTVGFEEGHREMVILRDIPFYSMCEHRKLARVVEILSRRPQIQERLTTQIAETILEAIRPEGVAVVIQAEHMCMTIRGVEKPGSNVVTSAMRGLFRSRAATRAEFLSLVQGK